MLLQFVAGLSTRQGFHGAHVPLGSRHPSSRPRPSQNTGARGTKP